ncbi:Copper-exporting P-type ATPase A, partial [termite gut metagenome]
MNTSVKKTYPALKMHCAGCANNVEKTVKRLKGVKDASVNFASGLLSITYESGKLTPKDIRKAVVAAGYDLIIEKDHQRERHTEEQQKRYRQLKQKVAGTWILAFPVLALSMWFPHIPYVNQMMLALASVVLIFFGNSFYVNAWK